MSKLLRHVRSRVLAGNAAEDNVHGHRVGAVSAHVGALASREQARDRRAQRGTDGTQPVSRNAVLLGEDGQRFLAVARVGGDIGGR